MKLISWNVNGLRACLTHDFAASFAALDADIFSVQETKMQPGQADFAPEGYTEYTSSAEKQGYSGTACWCREQPLAETTGIGIAQHAPEGRVLPLEYPGFWLVNGYAPNRQGGLQRLDSPGCLWPKFEDTEVGMMLAYTGAVKEGVIDLEELAYRLMELLHKFYPQTLLERYKVEAPEGTPGWQLLEMAGRKRGYLVSGGK